jgi:prophage tail gpP-like protein
MLSQELKNIKLTINLDRWEIDGKLIKPNSIIAVKNPEIYLFQKSNWFIESVRFIGDEKQRTATLTCVLPSVYDGSTPSYIFEGINLH